MVDESVRAFWTQASEVLRDRISGQDWCSWFAGAGVIEIGAERIVVEVVNDFAVRWIDERFRPVLEQTIADVAGARLEVVIVARAPVQDADRPHEQLARAARAHTREGAGVASAATPWESTRAPLTASDAPRSSTGTSMTEAELLAELAGADAIPSVTLDDQGDVARTRPGPGALSAPSGARGSGGRPVQLDHHIAGAQQLNDRYRFETFVIGPSNQMVHAAALSVAETPSQSYNPLFVHGSTGLGKTHLLHAIGHYVQETRPDAHVAYVTTEQFLSRFLNAIQASKTSRDNSARDRFKAYFRGVDVLLVDDIQFLAGKGTWLQEELFHIFNALHETGRQIVLTSDCKPDRIPQLEERLRSRFAWGLIADIDTPDRETRVAILRKKAQVDRLAVPAEVFEAIAERITTNVRELEGALTRVVAAASLSGRSVTIEQAAQVLEAYAPGQSEPVTIERIQHVVCEHFALDREDLLSQRRTQQLTLPRQIGMYLARTLIGAPALEVAQRFHRKDHTTVLYAEKKIDLRIREDREVHDLVAQLTVAVRGSGGRVGAGS